MNNITDINLVKLKIKSKSLADEAKTIRKEEHKLKRKAAWQRSYVGEFDSNNTLEGLDNIHLHRVVDVREEARATHLAIAFLTGKPYIEVEVRRRTDYGSQYVFSDVLKRAASIVEKYGDYTFLRSLKEGGKVLQHVKDWAGV